MRNTTVIVVMYPLPSTKQPGSSLWQPHGQAWLVNPYVRLVAGRRFVWPWPSPRICPSQATAAPLQSGDVKAWAATIMSLEDLGGPCYFLSPLQSLFSFRSHSFPVMELIPKGKKRLFSCSYSPNMQWIPRNHKLPCNFFHASSRKFVMSVLVDPLSSFSSDVTELIIGWSEPELPFLLHNFLFQNQKWYLLAPVQRLFLMKLTVGFSQSVLHSFFLVF
jgi:hypothetical protein